MYITLLECGVSKKDVIALINYFPKLNCLGLRQPYYLDVELEQCPTD